ncbi:hypothetical protein GIB67_035992 [Kingdonia uniflora]|uniref:Pre-mRNA-processing protein 40C n=1 Tax=Kingdonia uniflora TaxID=39325 RepID=A0A7J7N0S1_9MAGN|nr:hypothetical protein GIB67_035992 [Kingdonia uniflora]
MSSSAWLPQDDKSSKSAVISQAPGVSLPTPILSSPTAPTPPVASPSIPRSPSSNPSDPLQDSMKANFVNKVGFVVPASYISYGVASNTVITSGTSQQSPSSVMNSNPPASPGAPQPPVPGQSSGTGPSFSYYIIKHNNGTDQSHGGNITPPTSVASLQPPVLVPDQIPSTVPVPKGSPSIAAGFSFSRPPQLQPHAVSSLQGDASSNSSSSAAAPQEARTVTPASSSSSNVPLPNCSTLSSSSTSSSTPNLYLTTNWMPIVPSFPGHSGMPGPPGLPQVVSFPSANTVRPPIDPSSVRPIMQQTYSPYPSLPAMAPPVQVLWLQTAQVNSLHRPPFLPYPGMPGISLPFVSLPDSRPPAVSSVGPPGGNPQSAAVAQPELPPGTDHEKGANGDGDTAKNVEVEPWTSHKADSGVVYYYNAVTGESTYEKPSGFKGESNKATVQSAAVSCEKLAGTDWALVTTDDGKKYYYNTKNKVSTWQVPIEVTELKKKQETDSLIAITMSVQNSNVPISLNAPAVNTGGRDATALRPSGGSTPSSALDLIKKKLQEPGIPDTSGPSTSDLNGSRTLEAVGQGPQGDNNKDRQKDANGDGNMSESSSDSEDADNGPTKEETIIQFKEMLKDRGVAPFSKWEKELPKIIFDPRFEAVPGYSTRRSLFEHYVRTRAEEERKEKRAAQKAAVDGFKQLLGDAMEGIDHKTDYQSFKKIWGNDPRFEALDRKDRELLLNERVFPLKKAAEDKIQVIRAASASSFKSMLRDKGDISTSTRWSRVKDNLRNDPRYKSVEHEDRELLFNEYISELKAAKEEVERVAKAKREEKDKLMERERETRKRKEREEQEMERVRMKVRRKEAVSSYQALLVETIKDPQASWTESKPKLEKDPQGRASHPDLDQADWEKFFREHVKILNETYFHTPFPFLTFCFAYFICCLTNNINGCNVQRCSHEFQALLAEVITETALQVTEDGKTAFNSWTTAKRLLKPDSRYSKMPRRERESLWRRYVEEIHRKQKLTSDRKEDKLNTEATKGRSSFDSRRSPADSRRSYSRR